jgi:hypothetical protein
LPIAGKEIGNGGQSATKFNIFPLSVVRFARFSVRFRHLKKERMATFSYLKKESRESKVE